MITCLPAGINKKAGVPNSAIASRKERSAPAMMAGRTSGSVMRQVMRGQRAPSSAATRSMSEGISSSALEANANV